MKVTVKHKYATIGFIYLFGLICASFIGSIACFAVFAVCSAVFVFTFKKADRLFLMYITVFAAAFLISGMYDRLVISRSYELEGKTAVVYGRVTERMNPDNDTVLLSIKGEAEEIPVEFTLFAEDSGISVGDEVTFTAVFSKLKDNAYFSESSYYYSKGIFIRARAVSEIQTVKGVRTLPALMMSVSDWCKNKVDSELSGDNAGIVKAMLFGDKSGLSPRLSALIRRSGIAHLTAVSGMHLSLLVHITAVIIKILCAGKSRRTALFSILFTVMLMMFFGMTASVLRSGFMMILYYIAPFFHRKSSAYNSVGIALILILGVNPCACMDIGLWLSVLGTLGVGVAAPALLKRLKIGDERLILSSVISSVCACICTAPIGMLCFGGISLTAVITGLLVQPFFTLILSVVPPALIIPVVRRPVMFAAGLSAEIMNRIISFIGNLPFSYYEPDSGAMSLFAVILIVILPSAILISRRKRYGITALLSVMCACVISFTLLEIYGRGNVIVRIYSDGKNAILITDGKSGECVYTLSDSGKICDMIYRCGIVKPKFVCIAADTDNNNEIEHSFDCQIHIPENNDMLYDVGGDYGAVVTDGEIVLNINGTTIGLLPVNSGTVCDVGIYTNYSKNFSGGGNYATILCDEKFYNCGRAVNACYNETEIVIDEKGGIALKVK